MKDESRSNQQSTPKNQTSLHENKTLYHLLFETANDAIFFMKADRFLECNKKTLKMFDCTKNQIVGHTPYEFSPPYQPDGLESEKKSLSLIQAAYDGKPQFFEWKHKTEKGALFDAEVSLNAFTMENESYLQAIVRDITNRKQTEKELDEQLRFESLITHLSANLINLPAEKVDEEIEKTLKRIVEFFGVGRSVIVQPTIDGKNFRITYLSGDKELKSIPSSLDLGKQFSYAASLLLQGKIFQFSSLDELPDEATVIKEYYKQQGIQSSIAIPMSVAGDIIGSLSIAIFDTKRKWSPDIVKRLQLLGEILASTLLRKKSEENLKTNEKRLHDIINSSPDAITVADPDGNITLCNQATRRVHGYDSVDEIIGKNMLEFVSSDDRQRAINNTEKTLNLGSLMNKEYTLLRKDGTQFPGEISGSVHKDEAGRPIEFIGITKDITERKETELALQREKQFLDGIIDGLPGDFFIIDDNGAVIRWNKNRETILGYSAEELKGKHSMAHIIPEDQERIGKELTTVFQGKSVQAEYSIITKTGEIIPFLANGTRITVNHQNYIVGLAIDISDRKAAETALRESEERNRLLIDNVPAVIWTTDNEGKTSFISQNVKNVYGYTPDEIYEKGEDLFFNRIHKDDVDRVIDAFRQLFTGKNKYEIEYRIQRKDGKWIWLNDRASVTREIGVKQYAFGVFSDITDRKTAELELIERERVLSALLNAPTESAILVTPDGTIQAINEIAAKRLKKKPKQLIGMGIYDYLPPDLAKSRKQKGKQVALSKNPIRFEDERADRYYDNNIYPVIDSEGNVKSLAIYARDITEQRQSEIALQRSEEKYRLVVENANEAIIVLQKSKFMFFNQQTMKLLDCTINDIQNHSIDEFLHLDEANKLLEHRQRRENGEDLPLIKEGCIIDKKGQSKWIYNNSIVIEWEGQPATLHFMSDITDRKEAEEALRNNEERFRTLVQTAASIILFLAPDYKILEFNTEAERLYGCKRDDVIGENYLDLFIPLEIQDDIAANIKKVLKGESTRGFENEVVTANDKRHLLLWNISRYLDSKNKTVGIIAVGHDITERKRAEEELRTTQSLLMEALKQSPTGILIADAPDVNIRIANSAALDIRGKSVEPLTDIPAELHPQHWQTYKPDRTPFLPEELPLSQAILHGKTSKNVEAIIRRKGGEDRWVLANAAPIYNIRNPDFS